jgi:hypothetical protein
MTCHFDRDAGDYLTDDGSPCRRDDYGDPTHHCTARRTCSQHVGAGELTCARCLSRTRTDIRRIRDLAPLMLPVALGSGVDSEAANLAGPAADPQAWSERRIAMRSHLAVWERLARITEHQHLHARATMEDDDEQHPYSVLTRWEFALREDYHQPRTDRTSVTEAGDYLDRTLHRVAQDDEQDFPLLAREMRKCRNHLEGVLRDSRAPERGAPCPECTSEETGVGPRLVREYGHWCWDEDCDRLHYLDDSADRWVCPRNQGHAWTHAKYQGYVEERQAG